MEFLQPTPINFSQLTTGLLADTKTKILGLPENFRIYYFVPWSEIKVSKSITPRDLFVRFALREMSFQVSKALVS